jgi:hypothetical protein
LACLAVFSAPAKAGDYYDGYRRGDVWYTSSCCYRKVVRHVRIVRYVRVEPYDRYGYYARPHDLGSRPYIGYPHVGYYDRPWRRIYRYGYYRARYAGYADGCHYRRIPWADHRGGWVWAVAAYCY